MFKLSDSLSNSEVFKSAMSYVNEVLVSTDETVKKLAEVGSKCMDDLRQATLQEKSHFFTGSLVAISLPLTMYFLRRGHFVRRENELPLFL